LFDPLKVKVQGGWVVVEIVGVEFIVKTLVNTKQNDLA